MTSVTAHDYAWIRSAPWFGYALEAGYTLTLVRGVTPHEVLRVMEAKPQGMCAGVDELMERRDELIDPVDYQDGSFVAGAFTVPGDGGDWTLVLHLGEGGTGMQPRFLERLSTGRRAVSTTSGTCPRSPLRSGRPSSSTSPMPIGERFCREFDREELENAADQPSS